MIITNRVSIGKFRGTISTLGSRRIRPRPAFIAGLPGGILLPAPGIVLPDTGDLLVLLVPLPLQVGHRRHDRGHAGVGKDILASGPEPFADQATELRQAPFDLAPDRELVVTARSDFRCSSLLES